jgi:hypothetical protein
VLVAALVKVNALVGGGPQVVDRSPAQVAADRAAINRAATIRAAERAAEAARRDAERAWSAPVQGDRERGHARQHGERPPARWDDQIDQAAVPTHELNGTSRVYGSRAATARSRGEGWAEPARSALAAAGARGGATATQQRLTAPDAASSARPGGRTARHHTGSGTRHGDTWGRDDEGSAGVDTNATRAGSGRWSGRPGSFGGETAGGRPGGATAAADGQDRGRVGGFGAPSSGFGAQPAGGLGVQPAGGAGGRPGGPVDGAPGARPAVGGPAAPGAPVSNLPGSQAPRRAQVFGAAVRRSMAAQSQLGNVAAGGSSTVARGAGNGAWSAGGRHTRGDASASGRHGRVNERGFGHSA